MIKTSNRIETICGVTGICEKCVKDPYKILEYPVNANSSSPILKQIDQTQ